MQPKWKRAFIWSSLGGVALGAIAAAVRARGGRPVQTLKCAAIPEGIARIRLWTERYVDDRDGRRRTAHDRYLFQPTAFRAWSVIELPGASTLPGAGGEDIYHVTHSRLWDGPGPDADAGEERVLDRFYGTICVLGPDNAPCCRNGLARGALLEIAKYLVGGAPNGVEMGELHRSAAPILNFRFESDP